MEPTSIVPAKESRVTRVTVSERNPASETRTSQLVNSVLEIPISEGILLKLPGVPGLKSPAPALASKVVFCREPNCILKDPSGEVYTCWRMLLLHTRSTRASCGSFVPSVVATCPRRNITISPIGRTGCIVDEGVFDGCPGFGEGEGPGVGPGVGEGEGPGGFCA